MTLDVDKILIYKQVIVVFCCGTEDLFGKGQRVVLIEIEILLKKGRKLETGCHK